MGDSAKTIAAIIVVAMASAATTPVFVGTRADSMALRASDIGPGWHESERFSRNYTDNNTFGGHVILSEYATMSNETSIIVSELYVFNSSQAILGMFNSHRMLFNAITNNVDNVDIGEMGYIFRYGIYSTVSYLMIIDGHGFYANRTNIVRLEFIEGVVLSIITMSVKGVDAPNQPWIWDFILDVGAKQLQKVDRYSSY